MRISVSADEDTGVARAVLDELTARGHRPIRHGALAAGERADWAWASAAAARDVAEGRAESAVVCCWTGTGASIAAHKDGLWLKLVNLFSSHPVGFRRMAALYQVQQRGWDVYGKML